VVIINWPGAVGMIGTCVSTYCPMFDQNGTRLSHHFFGELVRVTRKRRQQSSRRSTAPLLLRWPILGVKAQLGCDGAVAVGQPVEDFRDLSVEQLHER
jgi:hypothetical protein